MDTDQDYSPHQLLPAPEPRTVSPPLGYFYNNIAKHLIKDTVRIMNNGLHIDLDKVEELEKVLDEQLKTVEIELANNPLIKSFQELQHKKYTKDYISDRKSKMRSSDYYLKPFDHKNMVHRSYFMDLYATQYNLPIPEEKLSGSAVSKWSNKLVKAYANTRPILQRLLDGKLTTHPLIDEAMNLLANDKANIYNEKYLQQIKNPEIPLPKFNPASSKQKQELIEAEKFSKETGLPSFDRSEIERINKETLDPDIKHFTQCFIDHSFAAIVRNNFIEAFYRYTVNNRLYGQYKLLGAKTGRYTSSNP